MRIDIATLLRILVSRVVIRQMSVGSLLVDYSITGESVDGEEVSSTQERLDEAVGSNSWLANTQTIYMNVSNETLVLESANAQPTRQEQSICGTYFDSGDCSWFLFGLIVIFVFLSAVATYFGCRYRAKKAKRLSMQQKAKDGDMRNPCRNREPIDDDV